MRTTIVLLILSRLLTVGSMIWAVVEFILYLVKDKPFNWYSVMACVIGIIIMVIVFIITINKIDKKFNDNDISMFLD